MNSKILVLLVALSSSVYAEEGRSFMTDAVFHGCDALENIGTIYEAPENLYIQEVKFFGRAQWQYGYTEGNNVDGEDFDEQYTEIRRLRAGIQVKAFNKLKFKSSVNLEDGGPDDHSLSIPDFDTATATYTVGDYFGLEDIKVSYGRQKMTLGAESRTSSKKIKTVERSNIGNFFYSGRRPTGAVVSAGKSNTEIQLGVFSTESDSDFIAGWSASEAYYFGLEHGGWQVDFLYNNVSDTAGLATEDDIFGYRWASSLAYEHEFSNWTLLINGLYGELLNDDEVYGVVVMPSTYLIEEKLELVMRYQFASAEDNTFRLTRRYAGEAGNPENGAKGSENQTIYAGLNYYLCGHRAKIQAGVEYETLDRENGEDADATTLWAAFRMYF